MRKRWSFLAALRESFCFFCIYLICGGLLGITSNAFSDEAGVPKIPTARRADSSQAQIVADTLRRPSIEFALQRLRPRLDAGYHAAPLHPYFRDEQRLVNDMRRLVFLADRTVIRGVETIPELLTIARELPVAKQTTIIRFAAAGSIANFAAETAMKHLRQHKLNFVQVEVEGVRCHTTLYGTRLSVARSLDKQTYTVDAPKLRAGYSHIVYAKFEGHLVHLAPLPRLGLSYVRWGELNIYNALYAVKSGFGLVSHDYTRKISLVGLRLQENKNWVGIFLIKNHRLSAGSWLRLDAWLVW
jgi:hypothetical protein